MWPNQKKVYIYIIIYFIKKKIYIYTIYQIFSYRYVCFLWVLMVVPMVRSMLYGQYTFFHKGSQTNSTSMIHEIWFAVHLHVSYKSSLKIAPVQAWSQKLQSLRSGRPFDRKTPCFPWSPEPLHCQTVGRPGTTGWTCTCAAHCNLHESCQVSRTESSNYMRIVATSDHVFRANASCIEVKSRHLKQRKYKNCRPS